MSPAHTYYPYVYFSYKYHSGSFPLFISNFKMEDITGIIFGGRRAQEVQGLGQGPQGHEGWQEGKQNVYPDMAPVHLHGAVKGRRAHEEGRRAQGQGGQRQHGTAAVAAKGGQGE